MFSLTGKDDRSNPFNLTSLGDHPGPLMEVSGMGVSLGETAPFAVECKHISLSYTSDICV